MTGRKKPKRGKKGAAAQSRIKPAKGITDNRTSINNSNMAISNDPKPIRSAGENDNFPESADLVEFNGNNGILCTFHKSSIFVTVHRVAKSDALQTT